MIIVMREVGTHVGKTLPDRIAEWLLAGCLFLWGLILLRPEDSFSVLPGLAPLARLASEGVWGTACLVVGGTRLTALTVNGWLVPHTFHVRSLTSFLSCLFWFTISVGLANSGVATTGLAIYPLCFPVELFCLYRTARDYKMHLALREPSS